MAYADLADALASACVGARLYVVMGVQAAGKSLWIQANAERLGADAYFFDAALPQAKHRERVVAIARERRVPAVAVWIQVPVEVAIARNALRRADQRVPDAAILNVHATLEPPTVSEGFVQIVNVQYAKEHSSHGSPEANISALMKSRPKPSDLMPSTVDYRFGSLEDALCLGVLATHVFLDTYATKGIRPDLAREALSVYSRQTFAARLADPNICFILAEVKGSLVAFAEVVLGKACPAPGLARVELARLYVQRPFQRIGIGQALARGAERVAKEHGFESMWLTAWSGNMTALAFYPAIGYRDIGATEYVIEGQGYENRIFAKEIPQRQWRPPTSPLPN